MNRIATAIETLAAAVAELAKARPATSAGASRGSSSSSGSQGYDDRPKNRDGTEIGGLEDLATEWGDPAVKYVPRGWDGPDFKGLRMSQTNPTFLRWLANELGRGIEKKRAAGDDEKAGWDRKTQVRAIGWCAKLGEGAAAKGAPADPFALTSGSTKSDADGDFGDGDDDIPF
jgi:hypothetical protein